MIVFASILALLAVIDALTDFVYAASGQQPIANTMTGVFKLFFIAPAVWFGAPLALAALARIIA